MNHPSAPLPLPAPAPNPSTGIMLVDDEDLLRSGLKQTLLRAPGFEVVAETRVEPGAAALAGRQTPDVVVLGVGGHNESAALELIGKLAGPVPRTGPRVVMLAGYDVIGRNLARAVRLGASGALLRSVTREELIYTVRQVAQGHAVLQPPLVSRFFAGLRKYAPAGEEEWRDDVPEILSGLSRRERDVLSGIVLGRSNQEIAKEIHLTVATVKSHVSNILTKLGARDRLQAALMHQRFSLLLDEADET
ncbi:LuxR C-terminal-related transcriptional regulator [Streptomyces ipomoeae]|uniref:LuxR C-terminal-related transcriptional regulator n=1 Tax=Streptomyces ipomoeae TaxID=103232 RepID=UPI00114754C8|nr:response regulator transcription factor [Streptomyces ipomoeae]MDX2939099.1 response regulator transcription factor [Streptomyces ipomoeae]TQE30889.1 response regulator transcription factor [Streptomyces ipomoeae]